VNVLPERVPWYLVGPLMGIVVVLVRMMLR